MEQYPHILKVKSLGDLGVDEDGFPIPGTSGSIILEIECREEPNTAKGAKKFITIEGGELTDFGSKIYLPKECDTIKYNTQIEIWDSEGLRVSGRILRFSKNQLNCEAWV